MALALAAGGLASAAYFEAKFQLWRDYSTLRKLDKAEKAYAKKVKDDRVSPWYIFAETCKKRPNQRAIWTRESIWTYGEVHDQTVKYAQWLLDQGIRPGDLVAIYLINNAEFIMLLFACHCIGAAPALINYNLEGRALQHCLDVCDSKILIVDTDDKCQARIEGSKDYIDSKGTKIFSLDPGLKRDVASLPVQVPEDKWRAGMKGEFPYVLLYTSGTTGLPKGCPFTMSRFHLLGSHHDPPFGCKPGVDCWYNCMPLYHGTGAMASTVNFLAGETIAIAPRFSVSGFWPDIHDSGSTALVYVGETARYLLNAPVHPLERKHKLRLAYGNGLRPDVWNKFQTRFNVPEIAEFFSSSEGMFNLAVWDRGPYFQNCVGHHGLIFRYMMRNVFVPVLIDHESGDIWRDGKTGFARRMHYEEGGEILVAVPNKEAFGGYWGNESATNKRFATDVFKKGDLYYRCGDALRRTPDGHWYFLDRLGDTYRWKSENVSTTEVAEVLGRYPGIAEANVYGVAVPGHEGRAGCAAIHLDPNNQTALDFVKLLKHARKELPKYAVPLFLRIVKASSHIHNNKQNKVALRKEGIDPNMLGTGEKEGKDDVILWCSSHGDRYVPFGQGDWESLEKARVRL